MTAAVASMEQEQDLARGELHNPSNGAGETDLELPFDAPPAAEDVELIRSAKELYKAHNYEECVAVLRRGGASGIPAAHTLLGECFAQGKGVKQDWASAAKCYRVGAMLGDPLGAFRLAACLQRDKGGTERNDKEALEWYQKAGAAGVTEALFRAGVICVDGKDLVSAMKLFLTAARNGHKGSAYNVAVLFQQISAVDKNAEAESVKWFMRSADRGSSRALNALGRISQRRGNMPAAVEFWQKAAQKGNAKAMQNLAICYLKGEGVEANAVEAVRLFRNAAELGNIPSQYNLSVCLLKGIGVEVPDAPEALLWLQKSAEEGDPEGCLLYGNILRRGESGAIKDEKLAHEYISKAAALGNKAAQAALLHLEH
ncbi:HCP-like protein [Gonapodya prolifera JEL478]|uniref:HCP-like protein n=1 Tax=Gonapodya prolifera (strain JEL478) TaxID=1344416 RepID=A0A139ALL5_GONPJ|nr:HCP-like protein [Gonapodya prolifera JEL478]|eukprot:KXS17660.1 HCP-like protein [Gonapodya prolifera JEL478]